MDPLKFTPGPLLTARAQIEIALTKELSEPNHDHDRRAFMADVYAKAVFKGVVSPVDYLAFSPDIPHVERERFLSLLAGVEDKEEINDLDS